MSKVCQITLCHTELEQLNQSLRQHDGMKGDDIARFSDQILL